MLRTELSHQMFPVQGTPPVRWRISDGLVPYEEAVATMEAEVAAIAEGQAPELVWLVEHPPLYTAGTSADAADLIEPDRFPVFATGRGGEYTYHGPGSASPMSCWTSSVADRISAPLSARSKRSSFARLIR